MDAPAVSKHVCERMIPLRHVFYLMPRGRRKETMSIPFAERTVLTTEVVLPDDLAEHKKSYILLQLYTQFSRTHLYYPIYLIGFGHFISEMLPMP